MCSQYQGGVEIPPVEYPYQEEHNRDSAPEVSIAESSSVSAQENEAQVNTTGSPIQNSAYPEERLNPETQFNSPASILTTHKERGSQGNFVLEEHSNRETQLVSPISISPAEPTTFQPISAEGVSTDPQGHSNEHSQLANPETISTNTQEHAQSATIPTLVDNGDDVSNIV